MLFFFPTKLDVELLSDVWQNFREMFYQDAKLDIAQYVSIPSISFSTMLKESKVKLELVSDINIFLLIEANLRGGYSGAHRRLCVSNHSEVPYANPTAPTCILTSQDFR